MPCSVSVFSLAGACPPRVGGIRSIIWGGKSGIISAAVNLSGAPEGDYYIELESNDHIAHRIMGRGSFQTVAQVNEDTGQVYYRDELIFQPDAADQHDLLLFVDTMSRNGDDGMFVIVEPNSGMPWMMGYGLSADAQSASPAESYPVFLTAAPVGTGTELGDLNGGSVTLASVHPRPAAFAVYNPEIV